MGGVGKKDVVDLSDSDDDDSKTGTNTVENMDKEPQPDLPLTIFMPNFLIGTWFNPRGSLAGPFSVTFLRLPSGVSTAAIAGVMGCFSLVVRLEGREVLPVTEPRPGCGATFEPAGTG